MQRSSITRWTKHFNTTNLRKHLQSHAKEYKEFCEKEATKNEEGKLKKANFEQLILQSVAEKQSRTHRITLV